MRRRAYFRIKLSEVTWNSKKKYPDPRVVARKSAQVCSEYPTIIGAEDLSRPLDFRFWEKSFIKLHILFPTNPNLQNFAKKYKEKKVSRSQS